MNGMNERNGKYWLKSAFVAAIDIKNVSLIFIDLFVGSFARWNVGETYKIIDRSSIGIQSQLRKICAFNAHFSRQNSWDILENIHKTDKLFEAKR